VRPAGLILVFTGPGRAAIMDGAQRRTFCPAPERGPEGRAEAARTGTAPPVRVPGPKEVHVIARL